MFAPLFEEAAKGLGLVLLWLLARHEFDDLVDGMVYGGLIGLGFAIIQDFLYYLGTLQEEGLGAFLTLFFIRGILSGFGHPFYTALTGIGLGLARQSRGAAQQVVYSLLGYDGAVLVHSLWNTPIALGSLVPGLEWLAVVVVFGYPLLVLLPGGLPLFLVAVMVGRRRTQAVSETLKQAVEQGLVDAADVTILTRPWQRRARQLHFLTRYGWQGFWLRRNLDIQLVDWAYRVWHRARGDRLPGYPAVFE